jgi:hypothetical protein
LSSLPSSSLSSSLSLGILHEGDIDKRVQYTIEALFAIRKSGFKDYPAIPKELDLVEREDQITFELGLDDEVDKEEMCIYMYVCIYLQIYLRIYIYIFTNISMYIYIYIYLYIYLCLCVYVYMISGG